MNPTCLLFSMEIIQIINNIPTYKIDDFNWTNTVEKDEENRLQFMM